MKDDKFTTPSGIVNLHATIGTHEKTRKIAFFAKILYFLRSKAFHRVSLHFEKCH